MTRPEITKMLSDLLVSQRLSGLGKYYAKEVSIDYNLIAPGKPTNLVVGFPYVIKL